jgi:hypothetical protein
MNFARSTSAGFQGTWQQQSQSFAWSRENDFLLTWDLPTSMMQINITASDAVQANGPLTLLHAIGTCQTGALASFLQKARESQKVSLHLVGVNSSLEPAMEWDRFLMGPLLEKHRRLVEAFNLPVTPFAGMTVSLLFSGTNRAVDTMQEVKRSGPFPEGYSESFVSGLYHSVVDEIPDLVLAINPGFAIYPSAWWPTLNKLHFLQVPIVATGYSGAFSANKASNIRKIYEHHRSFLPELEGQNLHLSKRPCRNLKECLRTWSSQGKVKVHELMGDSTRTTPTQQCQEEASTDEVRSVCGDLDGNAFLATRAGYKVRLSTHQPFAYCDEPARNFCQSSAVVSIFEPGRVNSESFDKDQGVPATLLRDDLYDKSWDRWLTV